MGGSDSIRALDQGCFEPFSHVHTLTSGQLHSFSQSTRSVPGQVEGDLGFDSSYYSFPTPALASTQPTTSKIIRKKMSEWGGERMQGAGHLLHMAPEHHQVRPQQQNKEEQISGQETPSLSSSSPEKRSKDRTGSSFCACPES